MEKFYLYTKTRHFRIFPLDVICNCTFFFVEFIIRHNAKYYKFDNFIIRMKNMIFSKKYAKIQFPFTGK